MSITISSIKHPIKFYEELFTESGFNNYRDMFFAYWEYLIEEKDRTAKIFKDEDFVIDYILPKVDTKHTLSDDIKIRSEKEFENSKKLYSEAISMLVFYKKPIKPFINEQINLIKELLDSNYKLIEDSPFLFSNLNSLIQHLKSFINENPDMKVSTSETFENPEPITDEDELLVHNIFGYLKEAKEFGVNIISESEYNRMVGLILEMIKKKGLPKIEKEIEFKGHIKIEVLRYTFYVLQLSLIGKNKEEYFYQFMINAFRHFKDTNSKNLGTKISTIPKVLPDYVPEIIRKQITIQIKRRN